MKSQCKILHLIGSGVAGGREKQLYLVLKRQSILHLNQIGVIFQNAAGPNYELISQLKNVKVYTLPSSYELSIPSMTRCFFIMREYDIMFLHSPRIAFMLPLIFVNRPVIYRLSGMQIISPRLPNLCSKSAPAPR